MESGRYTKWGKNTNSPTQKGRNGKSLARKNEKKKGKDGRYLEIFRVEGRKRLCSFCFFFPPML
jgi:hypothetical protein